MPLSRGTGSCPLPTSSLFATNPSLRCSPELLVRHRPVLTMALTVGCALVALAGCGSSASSSAGGATSSSSASAGTPVTGGNLVFANPQDAQSLDESTVFDNNSIWIIEQITQPLFTVTSNGKGVSRGSRPATPISKDRLTYTITLRKGVKFSNGTPDDVQGRAVQPGADDGRLPGLGLHRLRHQVGGRAVRRHGGGQPEVQVGAHPGRPGAVRQRRRARQLRRQDRDARSTRRRSAPARSSSTTGTRAARSSSSRTPTTGSRASPTWTA